MGEYIWLPPLAAFLIAVIGWLFRELHFRRESRKQAARDSSETLREKKALLEDMICKTQDDNAKQTLLAQLDEVNAALLGLYGTRLRHTLKEAGLPAEEILIANGHSQLKPKQFADIMGSIEVVRTLPQFLSTHDLLVLGNAYYYAEQYKDALNIFNRILILNPDEPTILHNRGVIYGNLGKYDKALADFNHSLELRPDFLGALINRGNTYTELGKYDEALVDLNCSLKLAPNNPIAFNNRGNAYFRLKKYNDALADFSRSLKLRPDDPGTLSNRGTTCAKLKRYEEALADFNRSLELRPDDAGTLYNLACLFSLWGKTDDALTYLKKAINLDEKYRKDAKTDEDFDNIRDDPRFKKLIEPD